MPGTEGRAQMAQGTDLKVGIDPMLTATRAYMCRANKCRFNMGIRGVHDCQLKEISLNLKGECEQFELRKVKIV